MAKSPCKSTARKGRKCVQNAAYKAKYGVAHPRSPPHSVGTPAEVYAGEKHHTKSGLTKNDLVKRRGTGIIESKCKKSGAKKSGAKKSGAKRTRKTKSGAKHTKWD